MRKNRVERSGNEFSILTLDDDKLMTETLQSYFRSAGYQVDVENDPYQAVERIRNGRYDILLLDFLMSPICGDEVVARIRQFNTELYIILLTGHKSLAPPIKTIRELDIQGYYEKSDRFDQLELLVESCVKSIRQMRTIRQYRDGLNRLVDCAPRLYQLQPIRQLLQLVLRNLRELCGCEDAFVYVEKTGDGAEPHPIRFFQGCGRYAEDQAAGSRAFAALGARTAEASGLADGCLEFPLVNGAGAALGVLGVAPAGKLEDNTLQLLTLYAKQAASAVLNALLHAMVNRKKDELDSAYEKLRGSYYEIITAMRSIVDARDLYTRGHSDRVSYFASRIAEALGKDAAYVERVSLAGLFHDVGKIATPDEILLKNTGLTPEEYNEIKKHPTQGRRILAEISAFRDVLAIIESHHEWVNGMGYPRGLSGEDIPEEARIISVADAFDAMTSHRRYRKNMTMEQAVDQLIKGRGTQFDARAVDAFLGLLRQYDAMKAELAWTYAPEYDNLEYAVEAEEVRP